MRSQGYAVTPRRKHSPDATDASCIGWRRMQLQLLARRNSFRAAVDSSGGAAAPLPLPMAPQTLPLLPAPVSLSSGCRGSSFYARKECFVSREMN
jgi:hypothetical protein